MRRALSVILLLASAVISPAQQTGPASHFDGNSWWAHVKFLADDSLEGRDTGSEGLRKAQAYAVEQLQKAGLEPAGTNGFYQTVRFNQFEVDEAKSSLALVAGGKYRTGGYDLRVQLWDGKEMTAEQGSCEDCTGPEFLSKLEVMAGALVRAQNKKRAAAKDSAVDLPPATRAREDLASSTSN